MQYSEAAAKNPPLDMEKWRSIIDGWNSSQENQKDYCHRLGISFNTFSYAKGRLHPKNKIKSKFIPVTLGNLESSRSHTPNLLILENPRGFKLHISSSLSSEQLSNILKLSGW